MREKSEHITIQIFATNNHCLATKLKDNSRWLPICGVDDEECVGTKDCNYVECYNDEPLPPKLPPSPEKGQQNTKTDKKEERKQTSNSNTNQR